MNKKLSMLLGAVLLATAPAGAQPAPSAAPQEPAWHGPKCLEIGQIWNWNAPNDHTLIVEDNWHDKFKLSLMAPCINLTFKERVGFKAIGGIGGLSCLSRGDYVLVRDPGFPQRCPITNIVQYTPDLQKADADAAAAAKAKQNNP